MADELGPQDLELAHRLARELRWWEQRILEEPASEWSGPEGVIVCAPATELLRPALVEGELTICAEGKAGVLDVTRPAPRVQSGTVELVRRRGELKKEVLSIACVATLPAVDAGKAAAPWSVRLEGEAKIIGSCEEVLSSHAVDLGDADWLERAPSADELARDVEEAAAALEREGYRRL